MSNDELLEELKKRAVRPVDVPEGSAPQVDINWEFIIELVAIVLEVLDILRKRFGGVE